MPVNLAFAKLFFKQKPSTKKKNQHESRNLLRRVNEFDVLRVELTFTKYVQVIEAGRLAVKETEEAVVFNAGHPVPEIAEIATPLPTTVRGDENTSENTDPNNACALGFVKLIIMDVVAPATAGLPGNVLVAIGLAQTNSVAVLELLPAFDDVTVTWFTE